MKNFLKVSLTSLLAASLISCSKGDEKKPETAVYKPTQKTADDIEGLWAFKVSNTESFNTELPTPFAIEINTAMGLYIHQYEHQAQAVTRNYIGSLTIVGENRGEVIIDRPSYMKWLEPNFKAQCGESSDCIEAKKILASKDIGKFNPSWDYDGAGASNPPSYLLTINLRNIAGGSFQAKKISADQFAKLSMSAKEDSGNLLGVAQRQLSKGPQGRLRMSKLAIVYPLTTGTETELPIDTTQEFACIGANVPVPRDIQIIEFQENLQLLLNDRMSEAMTFTKTGQSTGSFAFWNPNRCGKINCSRVSIDIFENEVRLEETVDGCFKVISTYSKVPQQ